MSHYSFRHEFPHCLSKEIRSETHITCSMLPVPWFNCRIRPDYGRAPRSGLCFLCHWSYRDQHLVGFRFGVTFR